MAQLTINIPDEMMPLIRAEIQARTNLASPADNTQVKDYYLEIVKEETKNLVLTQRTKIRDAANPVDETFDKDTIT